LGGAAENQGKDFWYLDLTGKIVKDLFRVNVKRVLGTATLSLRGGPNRKTLVTEQGGAGQK